MKKLMTLVAGAVFALCAFADSMAVEYVDEDGCLQTTGMVKIVTADTDTLESGWYVVTGEVSRSGIDVASGCTANLILADGASLTAQGGLYGAGINVSLGETLNIYGQRGGTGQMTVQGKAWCAGIGGGNHGAGGTVTINGGIVTAMGGDYGAGIGGGYEGEGGIVTINGGQVTTIGQEGGKGIGGGSGEGGGKVTINGGTIVADGWNGQGLGEQVKIDGGSIKTKSMSEPPKNSDSAAVYCVTVMVESVQGPVVLTGLPDGYGTRDVAPIEGKLYLYLPNGDYAFEVNGVRFAASVNGAATTAIRLFTVTVPAVVGAAVSVTTNGAPVEGFAGEELIVPSNTTVTVEYVATEGWVLWGEAHFKATVDVDLRLPAEGNEPTAIKLFTVTVPMVENAAVSVMTNGAPVEGFAGEELIVPSNTTVTVEYVATEGWALHGETHFKATVDGDLRLPAEGNEPTAIKLFTVTVPMVENAAVSVTTNGAPVEGFAGEELIVPSNTTVTVEYVATEGWALHGETHFKATVDGDLRLPAEGKEPAVLRQTTYMASETNEAGRITLVERVTNAVIVTELTDKFADGWYVVEREVARGGIEVTANCTANLILADGASLSVTGAGIVTGEGAQLNVFRQSVGTGGLTAVGGLGNGTRIYGGIFGMEVRDSWCGAGYGVRGNYDPATAKDYPWTVQPLVTVALEGGLPEHVAAEWTCEDGSGTNAIRGTSFEVPLGTINVKVIFTSDLYYSFADGAVVAEVSLEDVNDDCTVTAPEARKSEIEALNRCWYVTAPNGVYVDTLFQPDSNTRVEMDVLVGDAKKREYWFGCWTNDWNNGAFALGNDYNNKDEVYCGYGSGATCGGIKGIIPSGRVTVALEKGVVYTNGVVWSAAHADSNTVFALNQNLYLFAQNRSGKAKPGDGQERIVCYGCWISTNGVDGAAVPVRNFVSARTKDERQAVGLYDMVEGRFFAPCEGTLMLSYDAEADKYARVTVGELPAHVASVAWTSGDGSETNAIKGVVFEVLKGTENVKVIFTPEERYALGKTEVALGSPLVDDYALPVEDLPTATYIYARVTVGELPAHVASAAWTGGDGSETNAIKGGVFEVLKGTENVKVIFTAEERYALDKTEVALGSPLTDDYVLPVEDLPTATYIYARVTVGELPAHVTAAWTGGDGSETNAIKGVVFEVLKGTENVKVIFTADPAYSFADGAFVAEVLLEGIDGDCSVTVPEVRKSEIAAFGRGWYVTAPNGVYVDTLFKPDSNTRVEMEVLVGDDSKREYWFGCWDGDWNDRAFALGNDGKEVYRGYGSGSATCGGVKGLGAIPSGRVTVALEKGIVYTNGVAWSGEPRSDATFALDHPLYLFAQNRKGTAKPGDGQERIVCYWCKIWTNGVNGASLVRNFVPARTKDVRQTVGLYDTVTGEFFAPRGETPTLAYDEDVELSVTIGEHPHIIAAWTSGDGSVTNSISGGLFKVRIGTENVKVIFTPESLYSLDKTEFALQSPLTDDYTLTEDDLPTATYIGVKVTVGELPAHVASVAWTSGDGSETNAIKGGVFEVLKGTENVKVIFTPEERYALDKTEVALGSPLVDDYALPVEDLPTATYIYARVTVGELPAHVASAAWTGGDGSETNAIKGGVFEVLKGTENVKVIFTADPAYELVEGALVHDIGTVNEDCAPEFGDLPQFAHRKVEYVDEDGQLRMNDTFTVVTAQTALLEDGWYVAENTVTCGVLVASGEAKLILADGCDLTVNGGVRVENDDSLAIYGQAGGSGAMSAQGAYHCAGIGGGAHKDVGTVMINGGMVLAQGGESGAGIGGGDWSSGGALTINGGMVTATGGLFGAGIGGGYGGAGGEVAINGGAVDAVAGKSAVRIGHGEQNSDNGTIELTGGVFTWRVDDDWSEPKRYVVVDNPDPGTQADYPYAVIMKLMVTLGELPAHVTAAWTSGDGSETNAIKGGVFEVLKGTENVKVIFTADPAYELVGGTLVHAIGTVNEDCALESGDLPQLVHRKVEYVDADGKLRTNDTFMVVTVETAQFSNGWYLVEGMVSRDGIDVADNCTANLILADGASLMVQGAKNCAGIDVQPGETLNIYGQHGGSGQLTATGGYDGAGIGGGYWGAGGDVTINGGTVTATGGYDGAGVGGGYRGDSGIVTINGGVVTATGGNYGAGIGGGDVGAGGTVTINGGTVMATGGDYGACIGGGYGGAGGAVTINGGTVTATGGYDGVGIGGGAYSDDDGFVAFGAEVAGGVLTDCGVMTLDAYAADHSAMSVTLPVAVVSIPQVKGLVYAVSNGTEEVTGIGLEGQNLYAAATGDTFRVYFTLVPGCTYATEPPDNPMEISVRDWFTTIEEKDMPQVSVPVVEYLDWDGKERVRKSVTDYTFVTSEMSAFEAGKTYVVAGEVVRQGGVVVDGTPDAPTYLILCDGAKLTVTGTSESHAALRVASGGATTNALVICGQAAGTGELVVSNLASYAAAIGGDDCDNGTDTADCGIVTINGGRVTATGGYDGAGIGGGYGGAGGKVTINGGTVTATGGEDGTGIGGGAYNDDDGFVEFGAEVAGGVLTDCGVMTLDAYADDHSAESVTLPVAVVSIPQVKGLVYAVSNGTEAVTGIGFAGQNLYVAATGDTLRVYISLVPGCTYTAEPQDNPMEISVRDWFTMIEEKDMPQVSVPVVEYLDWDGKELVRKSVTDYTFVTSEMSAFEAGKTYVVAGEVVRQGGIVVDGTPDAPTYLILGDGAKLTVTGTSECHAALRVAAGGATTNALVICGQAAGTGELVVSNLASYAAAIGGGNRNNGMDVADCGIVTINGGRVTATGGYDGAGVGGGLGGNGGAVTINGGTVTATGGYEGAGVGGGLCGNGGAVTINGGTVTATGGYEGAGVGGGLCGNGGAVTINGGTVTATGGYEGAGIGGGAYSDDDGFVEFGAEVAGGVLTDCGVMTLDAYADDHSAESVTLPVAAVFIPQVNGLVYAVSNGTEAVTGIGLAGQNLYAAATGDTLRVYFTLVPGCTYAAEPPDNPMEIAVSDWFTTIEEKDMPQVSVPAIEYFDWDGKELVKKSATDYTFVTSEMSAFEAGKTYVVAGEVVRQRGVVVDGTPDAPTYLILGDGAKLTVTGTSECHAALRVAAGGATTNALVICGQAAGTGELVVSNLASYAAAIGGDDCYNETDTADCGIVTINGGRVTATGGKYGAGIGGGYEGSGGIVKINCGRVTATGGECGAGIGGGINGAGGTVTINGGTVTATGGSDAAGIGGGENGAGGKVTINGGTVTATGGSDAAGIGGGEDGPNGTVTLDETKVEVVEGAYGNGSSYVKIAEKKPVGPTCEGGTIEWSDAANAWVVAPTGGVTAVTVGGLPDGDFVAVPPTVSQVSGVADAQIKVRSGTCDITGAFMVSGGAIALNPEGKVTIGDDEIPVRPTIGDLDVGEPFVVGEGGAAVTVRTIPGLKYELKRATDLGADFGAIGDGVTAVGDGTPVTLTDPNPPKDRAFYRVEVSVP